MDAEELRSKYNSYFSSGKNAWTSSDLTKTKKVASQTLTWAKDLGFKHKNITLLDVGCATGFYTESFRLLGCTVTGLDYSEIAIEQASDKFPHCNFVQMNGFDPVFAQKFDMIFCRGFSGANTHDLNFLAQWINKYLAILRDNGLFVFAYSSDFSGKEKDGEIVNLSKDELASLAKLLNGRHRATHNFYYFGFISKMKKMVDRYLLKKQVKDYFYMFIQKAEVL
jgi:SAM-dependent methyltransferase